MRQTHSKKYAVDCIQKINQQYLNDMLSFLEMSVGSHKHTSNSFETKNYLMFSGLDYVIDRQIFIFILVCFLSNAWSLLWMLLLIENQSVYFDPRCSNSPSFLEVCFQSHSLCRPSVIMLFFTLYSTLKTHVLGTKSIYWGGQGAAHARRPAVEVLGQDRGSSSVTTGQADGWLWNEKFASDTNFEVASPQ